MGNRRRQHVGGSGGGGRHDSPAAAGACSDLSVSYNVHAHEPRLPLAAAPSCSSCRRLQQGPAALTACCSCMHVPRSGPSGGNGAAAGASRSTPSRAGLGMGWQTILASECVNVTGHPARVPSSRVGATGSTQSTMTQQLSALRASFHQMVVAQQPTQRAATHRPAGSWRQQRRAPQPVPLARGELQERAAPQIGTVETRAAAKPQRAGQMLLGCRWRQRRRLLPAVSKAARWMLGHPPAP